MNGNIIFFGLLFATIIVMFIMVCNVDEPLECEEGEYKVIAIDFKPHGDEWKIQSDGTYACCVIFNGTMEVLT